jgi:uncharacterized protein
MLLTILGIYVALCVLLYFIQEKLIFFPSKISKSHLFTFETPYEELNIKTNDGNTLNGLLFKTDQSSKGLIFYLHGNAGSIDGWGDVSETYTNLGYDVFILDYRGYGKSTGSIISQEQLFEDNQIGYDELKKRYSEDKIVVIGYSIGSGMASYLASKNNPSLLILQAPYYSLTDMMRKKFPVLPTFILKYKLSNSEYLKECKMPVVLFHGDQDEVIYYGSSLKLQKEFKKQDLLITLTGQGHNGMTENRDYQREIRRILMKYRME